MRICFKNNYFIAKFHNNKNARMFRFNKMALTHNRWHLSEYRIHTLRIVLSPTSIKQFVLVLTPSSFVLALPWLQSPFKF